jgi:hypothetical protein
MVACAMLLVNVGRRAGCLVLPELLLLLLNVVSVCTPVANPFLPTLSGQKGRDCILAAAGRHKPAAAALERAGSMQSSLLCASLRTCQKPTSLD